MKIHYVPLLLLLATNLNTWGQAIQSTSVNSTGRQEWSVREKDGNSRTWVVPSGSTQGSNNRNSPDRPCVVEVATGMNYWDGHQWLPSNPEFQPTDYGFEANQVQHQVNLRRNLNATGAVKLTTPDGVVLESTPVGIALYDAASGRFLVIGAITNCHGVLVGSNQVLYANAFWGVCADIVYTLDQGSFQQDVLITGRLNPADYGFPNNTTRIQVLTEFYQTTRPAKIRRPIYVERKQAVRTQMASPDIVDETLSFGKMVFGRGVAYRAGESSASGVSVAKEYRTINGRTFLIESVRYGSVGKLLDSLPNCIRTAALSPPAAKFETAMIPKARSVEAADSSPGGSAGRLAKLEKRPAVVIDYLATVAGSTSLFKGDTTYLVSGTVYCNDPTTIEGGTVLKYKSGATLHFGNTLTCQTKPYRPAIFTAVDDDTVGETMNGYSGSGYTGTISASGYANPAIAADYVSGSGWWELSHLVFRYAQQAVSLPYADAAQVDVRHSQFVKCIRGIAIGSEGSGLGGCGFTVNVLNGLLADIKYPLTLLNDSDDSSTLVQCYHCTFDGSTNLISLPGGYSNYGVSCYNSVFANITNLSGSVDGDRNGFYNSPEFGASPLTVAVSPFQAVAAGRYYLTSASQFRDQGSSEYSPSDLPGTTTWPPVIYSNITLTSATTLEPQVWRDIDTPDLGYHYDPVDVIAHQVGITNATLILTNGIVVGYYDSTGIWLQDRAEIKCEGIPTAPNRFVEYRAVQEQPVKLGSTSGASTGIPILPYRANGIAGPGHFRFTDFAHLAAGYGSRHLYISGDSHNFSSLKVSDCHFVGGAVDFYGGIDAEYVFKNNCFERVSLFISSWNAYNPLITFQNNLVWYGALSFDGSVSTPWSVTDNALDNCYVEDWSDPPVSHSHNGYFNTTGTLNAPFSGDVTNATFTYAGGPLGDFYHASTNLLNRGSQSAANAGLYHYTTSTNQVKETNSVVDIGYHYVAVGTNDWPLDSDFDGLPDYWEDTNGNGTNDSGETHFASWDTDGDDLSDADELFSFGTNPLNIDMDGDGFSDGDEIFWGLDPCEADPPYIWDLSNGMTVFSGSNATLTVAMWGSVTTNYHYQWRVNGRPIVSATNSTLTITGIAFTNAGVYAVTVSNLAGCVTSPLIRFTVWSPSSVWAWGDNISGQGDVSQSMTNLVGIAAGYDHCVAIKADKSLLVLGSNFLGETNLPENLTNVVAVAGGGWHNLALREDGTVAAWGWNQAGQTNVPDGLNSVVAIAAGHDFSYALRNDGTVVAWGDNSSGQTDLPADLTNVVAIAAGDLHGLAMTGDGQVKGWGANTWGQANVPPGMTNVIAVSAGATHSCIVREGGTVVAWGDNGLNQTNVPSAASNVISIASGLNYTMALRQNGTVLLWGNQNTAPSGLSNVVAIATKQSVNFALAANTSVSAAARLDPCDWYFSWDPNDWDQDGRSNAREILDGTNPLDTDDAVPIRLAHWAFDDVGSWFGNRGQQPVSPPNLTPVAHGSGYAAQIAGNGAMIRYRSLESDGSYNICFNIGTYRFWYKPNWVSQDHGGSGPGHTAQLIYCSGFGSSAWSLKIDASGNNLVFVTSYTPPYSQNGCNSYSVSASLDWKSSQEWHQITLTCGDYQGVSIYVDGEQLQSNSSIRHYVPRVYAHATGFIIGNDSSGTASAEGVFDDLETFNYEKSAATVLLEYDASVIVDSDSDGDGMDDAWETSYGLNPLSASDANSDVDGDGWTNLQEYRAGTNPNDRPALNIWTARPKATSKLP